MLLPRPLVFLAVLVTFATNIAAQTSPACPAPPASFKLTQPNIFTEQQEQWLGDAMADMVERYYKPVRDPAENEYLAHITQRLLATLPPTSLQFRVVLLDSPEVNGFSLAGGRVYLTRKLVANARSEDEVASVIAHEMGHILSHQFAIETTANFKVLLGVTSVSDKDDIYKKFQQLLDARLRQKRSVEYLDSDAKQNEADQIAVYATAAAGYRPQAYAEFWDRMFFVDGKLGGPLSDFFGVTKPESKRLRAITRMVAALPAGCGAAKDSASPEFQRWNALVVANQSATTGLTSRAGSKIALTPPLRMELERLRFSHDGKFLLAQDESSISVFSREPYRFLFGISAENALPAEFSPDSQHIAFHTHGLHTEEWSIADQKLIASHDPITRHPCLQTKFSPDGRTLFCFSLNAAAIDLAMLDAATGNLLYEKKEFFTPTDKFLYSIELSQRLAAPVDLIPSSISADGNVLLLGPDTSKLAFDLRSRTLIPIGGGLKNDVTGPYAFIGNDSVLGISMIPAESGVYSFPAGKLVRRAPFRLLDLESTSSSSYVLSHDLKDYAVGLADVSAAGFVAGSRAPAMDVWDDWIASERGDGSVTLHKLNNKDVADKVIIPPLSPLGANIRTSVSRDRRLLAVSTRTRAAIWDLRSGKQISLSHHFNSAMFAADDMLYLEFPKTNTEERGIYRVAFAPLASERLPYKESDATTLSIGTLHEWKTNPGEKGVELVVHDVRDNSKLWSRKFSEGKPGYAANIIGGETLLGFPLKSEFARERVKEVNALASEAAVIKDRDYGRLIQVLDNANGSLLHELVIEVPPYYEGVAGVAVVGDSLYLSSAGNRTSVYSLSTSAKLREVFGYIFAADSASGYVCTINRSDEATVYDANGAQLAQYRTGTALRFATFHKVDVTGVELILLTSDQVVHTMQIPVLRGPV
jgi:Peptidase family M48